MMNKDQVEGRIEAIARKDRIAVGTVVRNATSQRKGRMEDLAGKVRAMYDDAKHDKGKE